MDGFAAKDMYMLVISSARIVEFTHINASLARSSSKEKFMCAGQIAQNPEKGVKIVDRSTSLEKSRSLGRQN